MSIGHAAIRTALMRDREKFGETCASSVKTRPVSVTSSVPPVVMIKSFETFCACSWPRNMSCAHLTASSDSTICDPLQKALIQQRYGCKLEDTPEGLLQHLVAQFRARGNAAFRYGQYAGARTWTLLENPT